MFAGKSATVCWSSTPVGRWHGPTPPWTPPTPDRPKSFFYFGFWVLFLLFLAFFCECVPLRFRPSLGGLLVAPWWCRKDMDKTWRPVGATRRPQETTQLEGNTPQEGQTKAGNIEESQTKNGIVGPSLPRPHLTPPGVPVVRSDAERTLLRMFAFLGHSVDVTSLLDSDRQSKRVPSGVAQAGSTEEAIIGRQSTSDTVGSGGTTPSAGRSPSHGI